MSIKYWIKYFCRPSCGAMALLLWAITGCTEAEQTAASTAGGSPNKVLAVVNGVELTEARILSEAGEEIRVLDHQRLEFEAKQRETRHEILRRNLDRLISEELIKTEADAQGLSKEELLKAQVGDKLEEPSQEEIDRIYEINRSRLRKSKEEVYGQIVEFLKERAEQSRRDKFVESLRGKYTVEDRLEPLRYEIAFEGRPIKGASKPSVTLIEFSDFQCPYCTRFTASMQQVMDKYEDRVQRVFLQFPLNSIHPLAQQAAEASLCAHEQNKFWDLHARLFEAPMRLEKEALMTKATEIGLDMDEFKACLSSRRPAGTVSDDMQAGLGVGVSGTPALFVNGRPLRGAATTDQITALIEEELKAKGSK